MRNFLILFFILLSTNLVFASTVEDVTTGGDSTSDYVTRASMYGHSSANVIRSVTVDGNGAIAIYPATPATALPMITKQVIITTTGTAGFIGADIRSTSASNMGICHCAGPTASTMSYYLVQTSTGLTGRWGGVQLTGGSTAPHTGLKRRLSATSAGLYENGTQVDSSGTSASPADPSKNLVAFAQNNNGTIANYYTGTLGCIVLGYGITGAQAVIVSTAMDILRNSRSTW